jgi:hypothetical protein
MTVPAFARVNSTVIPAKAGIPVYTGTTSRIPIFMGMTKLKTLNHVGFRAINPMWFMVKN